MVPIGCHPWKKTLLGLKPTSIVAICIYYVVVGDNVGFVQIVQPERDIVQGKVNALAEPIVFDFENIPVPIGRQTSNNESIVLDVRPKRSIEHTRSSELNRRKGRFDKDINRRQIIERISVIIHWEWYLHRRIFAVSNIKHTPLLLVGLEPQPCGDDEFVGASDSQLMNGKWDVLLSLEAHSGSEDSSEQLEKIMFGISCQSVGPGLLGIGQEHLATRPILQIELDRLRQ